MSLMPNKNRYSLTFHSILQPIRVQKHARRYPIASTRFVSMIPQQHVKQVSAPAAHLHIPYVSIYLLLYKNKFYSDVYTIVSTILKKHVKQSSAPAVHPPIPFVSTKYYDFFFANRWLNALLRLSSPFVFKGRFSLSKLYWTSLLETFVFLTSVLRTCLF